MQKIFINFLHSEDNLFALVEKILSENAQCLEK